MRTLYSCIIGQYDSIKQPFNVSQHWRYLMFTDQDFDLPKNNVWEIVKVPVLECGPAKTARRIKILFHEYIDTEESLFIDGTFFVNCDLNRWWRRFREPMTCITHPFDKCIYTDIQSCLGGKKGNFWDLVRQANDYKAMGIPENNGLIASGILMRRNTPEVIDLCKTWWNQVEEYSERDQIAFGYAAWKHPGIHNTIEWNYTKQNEFIHIPHVHKPWSEERKKEIMRQYGKSKSV